MMISNITIKALGLRLAMLMLHAVFPAPTSQSPPVETVSFVFHTITWVTTRGQTARFSVFNSNAAPEREGMGTIFVRVKLFGENGAALATSDEIAIAPGEFRFVDFRTADLPVPEHERLQTRAQVE